MARDIELDDGSIIQHPDDVLGPFDPASEGAGGADAGRGFFGGGSDPPGGGGDDPDRTGETPGGGDSVETARLIEQLLIVVERQGQVLEDIRDELQRGITIKF